MVGEKELKSFVFSWKKLKAYLYVDGCDPVKWENWCYRRGMKITGQARWGVLYCTSGRLALTRNMDISSSVATGGDIDWKVVEVCGRSLIVADFQWNAKYIS